MAEGFPTKPGTPRDIAESTGEGKSMSLNVVDYPEQDPDALQGEAPGGLYPSEEELPVKAVDQDPARFAGG